ncbi:MAG TPA: ADOP family duplicated permease, partial [Thermoanaerobaculia bacterium]|nr:ADOP family duplicated permease [Thermoanaerobaculia bacterium]
AHAGQDHVALLTYQLWQRRFGGRADIVGSAVQLDDESYSVVGVLPESFEFIMIDAGFWVPLSLEGELSRDRRDIVTMARLKPGVRYEAAQAELKGIADRLAAAYPEANRGLTLSTQNLRKEIPGKTDRQLLSLMQGAMLLVLLIACANIANLLLARGQDRQREFALRTTLGARRRTMLRQLLTESLLMALLGGLAGIGIGLVLQDGLNKMVASEIPKMMLPRMSLPVLGFTAGVTVLAAALFGLFPALISTRPQLASTLKDGARGSSLGGRKRLVSRGLVVAEVALALVMLCGTGLLVRSIVAVKNLNAGFDTSHLLTFSLNLPPSRYKEDAQVANGYTQAVEKLAALPGVRAAAVVENLPRSRNNPTAALTFEGKPLAEGATPPQVISLQISPRYFDVLGIRLLQGRALGAGDHAGSEPVVVVSQAFAKKYLEGASPLGQRLLLDGKAVSVAGVVADVVQSRIPGTKEVAQPIVYRPHAQLAKRTMSVMLRTERTPDALGEGVRQAIAALDPSLPVEAVRSLEENIALEFAGARAISLIVGGFGLVALLLSALGIYGVVAYSVAQRTHEIGVRIAIGARHSSVVSMVTRQGLVLTGIGLLVGLPGVYLVSRAVDATLEGVASSHQGTLP